MEEISLLFTDAVRTVIGDTIDSLSMWCTNYENRAHNDPVCSNYTRGTQNICTFMYILKSSNKTGIKRCDVRVFKVANYTLLLAESHANHQVSILCVCV